MKVIGICGSPRRGNTEWMLNQVMQDAARSGAEVETLLLRKMNIRMCRGCLACEEGGKQRPGICKIMDDMNDVYPKLLTADVIVLATPSYFEMPSGLLKNFLDRTVAIWPRLEKKTDSWSGGCRRRCRLCNPKLKGLHFPLQGAVDGQRYSTSQKPGRRS